MPGPDQNMVPTDAKANRPTLLLTRPEPQSQRFAVQVRDRFGRDWPILLSALMQIRFFAPPIDLSSFAGVIFSSENGVAAAAAGGVPAFATCYCVGQRTTAAARAQGWDVALSGADSETLASAIIAAQIPGPLLHLHGQHRAGTLAHTLRSAGIQTGSAVIYDQQPRLPTTEAMALLAGTDPVLVPLFSSRSAQLFQQAAASAQAPLWVAALSQAVADTLTLPVARLVVAERPDADALLLAIGALFGPAR